MRALYLFTIAIVVLFHFSPGYAQSEADTMECKLVRREICAMTCPPGSTQTGSCQAGLLKCCTKPAHVVQG